MGFAGGCVGFGTSTGVPCGCGCDGLVFSGFGVAGGCVGFGSSAGAEVAGGAGGEVGGAGGSAGRCGGTVAAGKRESCGLAVVGSGDCAPLSWAESPLDLGGSVGAVVAVGGAGVAVGGTGVLVGGTGVLVADGDAVADGLGVAEAVALGDGDAVADGAMVGEGVAVGASMMRSRTAAAAWTNGRNGSGGRPLALVTITALKAVTTARMRAAASKAIRWARTLRHQRGSVWAKIAGAAAGRAANAARMRSRCASKPSADIAARGAAYSSWATLSKGSRRAAWSGYFCRHSSTDAPR